MVHTHLAGPCPGQVEVHESAAADRASARLDELVVGQSTLLDRNTVVAP